MNKDMDILDDYYNLFMKYKDISPVNKDPIFINIYRKIKNVDRFKDLIGFSEVVKDSKFKRELKLLRNEGSYFYRDYYLDTTDLDHALFEYFIYKPENENMEEFMNNYNQKADISENDVEFFNTLRWEIYRGREDELVDYLKGYYSNPIHKDKFIRYFTIDIDNIIYGIYINLFIDELTLKLAACMYKAIVETYLDESIITEQDVKDIFKLPKNTSLISSREYCLFESFKSDLSNNDINKILLIALFPDLSFLNKDNLKGKTIMNIDLSDDVINREYIKIINKYIPFINKLGGKK